MRAPKERFDFVHEFLNRVFIDDLHAKRVLSLANGTLGVMTGAALAVSLIGQALAKARGLFAKSAIKQVDRLLSNAGVVPWDLFGSWVREVVGERRAIVVVMDWTDFDADNQSTLALHLVTRHGRATPLLWLTVDKDELKAQRNDFEDLCLSRLKALLPEGAAVAPAALGPHGRPALRRQWHRNDARNNRSAEASWAHPVLALCSWRDRRGARAAASCPPTLLSRSRREPSVRVGDEQTRAARLASCSRASSDRERRCRRHSPRDCRAWRRRDRRSAGRWTPRATTASCRRCETPSRPCASPARSPRDRAPFRQSPADARRKSGSFSRSSRRPVSRRRDRPSVRPGDPPAATDTNVLGGIGSPSGVRKPSRRSTAFFSLGLKPRMPSRASAAFILLTIRLCSPTRLSRSRLGRLASSSVIVGIATILQ